MLVANDTSPFPLPSPLGAPSAKFLFDNEWLVGSPSPVATIGKAVEEGLPPDDVAFRKSESLVSTSELLLPEVHFPAAFFLRLDHPSCPAFFLPPGGSPFSGSPGECPEWEAAFRAATSAKMLDVAVDASFGVVAEPLLLVLFIVAHFASRFSVSCWLTFAPSVLVARES